MSLLLALFPLLAAQDARIQWKTDHAGALEDAKKQGKYLLVHFAGPDCPWCEKMDKETYTDPGIIEFSNKGFINVGLDKERDRKLATEYKVGPIPVTFILSPEGERVSTLLGYLPAEDYRSGIEAAVISHKKLLELLPKMRASPADPALLVQAGDLYGELGDEKKAGELLARAAEKTPDPAARGELLVKAFHHLNDAPADDSVNQAMLSIADRMDALDGDGKLGLQDNAAYVRAMVDFNKENWNGVIEKLEALIARWPGGAKAAPSLLTLATVYHEAKHDNVKAGRALKTLIEKYPKSDFVERAKELLEHLQKHDEK